MRQIYQEDDSVVVSSVDFVREMYQEDGCVAFSSVDLSDRQMYQEDECVVVSSVDVEVALPSQSGRTESSAVFELCCCCCNG